MMNETLFNARSVANKHKLIIDYVISNELQTYCITETCIKDDEHFLRNLITPLGYQAISLNRPNRVGGGLRNIDH